MAVTLEQVEKLCERANISYDEAREMLEATNGDMLEAVIRLEKEGRIKAPGGNGYFNSADPQTGNGSGNHEKVAEGQQNGDEATSFGDSLNSFIRWCGKILHIGNTNSFKVKKDGKSVMIFPVTVLVLLFIFAFWITIPAMIIGLFFGYRYMFSGPEMKKTQVNRAMDSVAEAADGFKKKVKDSRDDNNHGENTDN